MSKWTKEYKKAYAREYASKNRIKCRTRSKEWAKNNPDRIRDLSYIRQYGITLEDYNRLFEEQIGCCFICKQHQTEFKNALCVDHNHETGEVRGLLCTKCNSLIGLAEDDFDILNRAIEYLKR